MQRWKIVLLSLLAILILAGIGLVRWMRPYDLETERKAARAAGIPLSAAELRVPVPPTNENAAAEYAALKAVRARWPLDNSAIDAVGNVGPSLAAMDARTAGALKSLINGRPDVSRLVHAAAAKPHCRFPADLAATVGPDLLPQFAGMRECARWIRWESVLLARNGRYVQAVKNQALGLRIARQAAEEPALIAYLVSLACQAIAMQGFEDILDIAGPNAAVADAVRREIAAYDPGADLTRCLKGEVVFGFTRFDGISQGKLGDWWYTDPSRAVYLHWMTRLIEASRAPASQRYRAMESVNREMGRAMGKRPTAAVTAILMPVLPKAADRSVVASVRRTLVSGMASVLAYRARNGRYPQTLSSAVSPVPADPYTGAPLGYFREGSGFIVFTKPYMTAADAKDGGRRRKRESFIRYPRVRAVSSGPPMPGSPPMPGAPPQ
ncbi:MAG TPA: hypothetical protein VGM51_02260 [Armatimonadota bacterium]|jgi:hypothetical protein